MFIKQNILRAAGVGLAAFVTFAGTAQAATETFDTAVVTGPTQAPGVWYTDRYAPAGFSSPVVFGGDERLQVQIRATDAQSGFTATQGRKFDLSPTQSMSIDLFVGDDWGTTGRRMAGFWSEGFGANPGVAAYPIIEFTSDGGVGRFRVWDSTAPGSYQDIGLPVGFTYGSWQNLSIELSGDSIIYNVGDLSATVSALGSTSINTVILQGHNTTDGVNYDIYWDNLSAPAAAGPIPEPATWAMMIGGFGLVGGAMRRRRSAVRIVVA